MKSIGLAAAAILSLLFAACASPGPPPHTTGNPPRSSQGNADLQGPTADDVIWQSAHQWHANRRHDARQRRY